jgi:hypothetical protein
VWNVSTLSKSYRTCPRTTAVTAGAAATGDLQPSTDIATNNIIHVSIQPPASQRPDANRTQPLSLPPQSLGGTFGGVSSVPARFPALTITWPILPHHMCIYVHTRTEKHSSSLTLNVFTYLLQYSISHLVLFVHGIAVYIFKKILA